ncbi:molecular chaperone (small heat shock protein) [Saccharomonospora marina XMU15]|uniref:Molecular chaperone (Small heat shock protein) n=1 Tax=Saccharomonospora marina XMU15 TaxID=882083 RepID=H5WYA3_9PSEU|nr:Hsp20/alpha crystallin family protein [Saccharomonospora marina]EHR48436.1 molecular chaperone (small heat shock protein) [Saccharomonospora marina XMU15]
MTLPAVRSSSSLRHWDPFREFEDLYSQMGRWMDSVAGRLDEGVRAWAPLADVTETEDAYLVEVDLPGIKRDDITIDVVGTELAINGEVKQKERQGWFRHRTRRTGQFAYRVTLPQDVNADKIEATLDEGVLTVRVPKTEAAKPRRIAINGK